MTLLANGIALTSATITWPWSGPMLFDLSSPDPITPVAGQVTVVMGNITAVCALLPDRSGEFAGAWRGLGVGGFAGWRKVLPAKGYRSPAGVVDAQVFADAAVSAGEVMAPGSVPRPAGGFYTRNGIDPASQVFDLLPADQTWWVTPQGLTTYGVRLPSVTLAAFVLDDYDAAKGRVRISSEEPGSFGPGVTFTDPLAGSFTVNSAVWHATATKLTGEIWTR